jgi:hypothetical protein
MRKCCCIVTAKALLRAFKVTDIGAFSSDLIVATFMLKAGSEVFDI